MINVLSVFQLNTYIKRIFEQDFVLKNVSVEGELSNYKKHSSGHIYFTLKDDQAQVSCVLFRSYLTGLEGELHDGAKVVVKGSVSLYEKSGSYQIYARSIEKSGLGDLHLLFERLKQKLQEEGLFSPEYKREIPTFATKIGIITSDTGAALRDIVQVAKRRNPFVELVLYPSLVQGSQAKFELVKAIGYFNTQETVDVIILGRGGGSIEDLWPFNEEDVARAIFASEIPIISAVGHETDFTISDFVSDLRAPTPSAAAELAVYDYYELKSKLQGYKTRFDVSRRSYLKFKFMKILELQNRLERCHPRYRIEEKLHHLEQLRLEYNKEIIKLMDVKRNYIHLLEEKLNGRSPLKRLEEGYGYISSKGEKLTSVSSIHEGQEIDIYLKDGKVTTLVKEIEVL